METHQSVHLLPLSAKVSPTFKLWMCADMTPANVGHAKKKKREVSLLSL